ncbi:MAG: hypothetical protein LUM44_09805 [Pyrinomonadaceae bacterium]|nr:hypothetical protein [Pyrinomonadaceae bacterium]
MSWTKTQYWEEICAMLEPTDEQEYFDQDELASGETQIDFFDDYKIDHAGREAFECPLCGKFNDVDFPHNQCSDEEKFLSEQGGNLFDEDLPW